MYNSKRFETVKNMRENKKISNAVQAAIGVLAVVLAALIVWMMVLVSGIQGTARVVNYAGLLPWEMLCPREPAFLRATCGGAVRLLIQTASSERAE